MKHKLWAAALAAALAAAAFFLPEELLIWGDRQRVDHLHVESRSEEREGFAESLRLTVPEKVMLLRSGRMTVMELDQGVRENVMIGTYKAEGNNVYSFWGSPLLETETAEDRYNEAAGVWSGRLTAVREELLALQSLGGLPEVWTAEGPLACTDCVDLLYLDPETRVSFQVYRLTLLWQGYNADLLVDLQSGRILSLSLAVWVQGGQPAWGARGASGFGGAWRDYWQMDSVSAGWYSEQIRSILEDGALYMSNSGDYAAAEQIAFLYDGLSLSVPLDCQWTRSRYFFISWNR